jgi:hypothetical protein
MKIIEVEKREIKLSDYVSAQESDYERLIKEDAIIKHDGKIICVYLHLENIPPKVIEMVNRIRYTKNKRVRGLTTTSRIFGFMPREKIRKDFCSSTSLAREDAEAHQVICDFGSYLAQYYKIYAPEIYQQHIDIVEEKVKDDWKLKEAPFTSGIINKNNPLKYHYDAGNFKGVYSNMVAFKRDVQGGYLAFPEYNFALEIADRTLSFFDGQAILHGVTPIKYLNEKSYRYTLVYYTLQQMWKCLEPMDELKRIKVVKTEREFKRFRRLKGEIPNEL